MSTDGTHQLVSVTDGKNCTSTQSHGNAQKLRKQTNMQQHQNGLFVRLSPWKPDEKKYTLICDLFFMVDEGVAQRLHDRAAPAKKSVAGVS